MCMHEGPTQEREVLDLISKYTLYLQTRLDTERRGIYIPSSGSFKAEVSPKDEVSLLAEPGYCALL